MRGSWRAGPACRDMLLFERVVRFCRLKASADRAGLSCENCPSCQSVAGLWHCRRPQISLTFPVVRLTKRGVSRSSRTLRRDAMDAAAHETNAPAADGKAVWSWHPDAGVKFGGKRFL